MVWAPGCTVESWATPVDVLLLECMREEVEGGKGRDKAEGGKRGEGGKREKGAEERM